MLSAEDYLKGYDALRRLRVKWYAGEAEDHKTSRATLFEVKVMLSDPTINRDRLLGDSLRWLGEHVAGLEVYEKIMGRPYTEEEKRRLTKEVELVSGLSCPLHGVILCGVPDEFRPQVATEINNALDWLPLSYLRWGFLPALIAAELAPRDLELLIQDGKIPDAKISTVSLSGMMEKEIVVA